MGPRVSIVINNYNYARFLPAAIASALGQDYPDCEVIVVDDGSQDDSAQVITGYGERIRPILKDNGGQASALNAGFAASQGEIVIFLDADDTLEPQAARTAAEVFQRQPGLARLQYRMAVMDASGHPTGATKPAPHVPVPSGDIRRQVLRFPFDIAWLPTSGNAFAARVLRQTMPIPEEYGRLNADYYLVHTAPLFGPVRFLDQVLASYRVHGDNNFETAGARLDMPHLRSTITYDELTHRWIRIRAQEAGISTAQIPDRNLSFSTAASRLVSYKIDRTKHPLSGDRLGALIRLGWRAAWGRSDTSLAARAIFAAWFVLTALAPRPLARWLAEIFFFPERRQRFSRLLGRLHARRSGSARKSGSTQNNVGPQRSQPSPAQAEVLPQTGTQSTGEDG